MVRIIIAAVVIVGLTYGGYELWPVLEEAFKDTPASDFKFLPIILVFFIALSLLDKVFDLIGRIFTVRS